jgi:hypothetical protein
MGLIAGLVLFTVPKPAAAAVIGFQNKLKMSITVEAATVVGGRVNRDNSLLIDPGKVAWHLNVPNGHRFINIYDANQPARLLFRGKVPVLNNNQKMFFSIQLVQPPRGLPQVQLVPGNPPADK